MGREKGGKGRREKEEAHTRAADLHTYLKALTTWGYRVWEGGEGGGRGEGWKGWRGQQRRAVATTPRALPWKRCKKKSSAKKWRGV
jgi:hypothetical protein